MKKTDESDYDPSSPRFRGRDVPKVRELVEKVLSEHPIARNDDAALHRRVELEALGDVVSSKSSVGEYLRAAEETKLPSRAATTKWRRWFQARGKYLPTDPLIAERRRRGREGQHRRYGRRDGSGR